MELMHNQVVAILSVDDNEALYRVLLDEPLFNQTVLVRIDGGIEDERHRGGRKKIAAKKRLNQKPPTPLAGTFIWRDRDELLSLWDSHKIRVVTLTPEARYLIDSSAPDEKYELRAKAMAAFLDYSRFRDEIIAYKGIGRLVKEAMTLSGFSRSQIYQLFSLLCRYGFVETSLKTRFDRCGAPGVRRPCDPGGRKKAGRKTLEQRIALQFGHEEPNTQPGMSTDWRRRILAADSTIKKPKPDMPTRCKLIVRRAFVIDYKAENGEITHVKPEIGTYPNDAQIRRVLEEDIPKLQRLAEQTTEAHFARTKRGLVGKSWMGVSGPGHTWAIDSTVGKIYLRSSINRTWILGRPIVYVVVDVWSTAIVGFYVCLAGPSWPMAKVALFNAAADPALVAGLWGYVPMISLSPTPTMPLVIFGDRGEYLSMGGQQTGAELKFSLKYSAPYRPDMKGIVEVPHRITKDAQYFFVPGAVDARRKEYEQRQFRPNRAVFTLPEYVAYLYMLYTDYNLNANRKDRLDAHMMAQGVKASPAGLWRWGHQVGIGVRRFVPEGELIRTLLPNTEVKVTRDGVKFAGMQYTSDVINTLDWPAHARNFGSWDASAFYYPGSVSRIWLPNAGGHGMMDLSLSDYSTASPECTLDEVLDAFQYSVLQRRKEEHDRTMSSIEIQMRMESLIAEAQAKTSIALEDDNGPKPTITEARQMEYAASTSQLSVQVPKHDKYSSEAMDRYDDMMQRLLQEANTEVAA